MDLREESCYTFSEDDKNTAFSPLALKCPIVDCAGLLILGPDEATGWTTLYLKKKY